MIWGTSSKKGVIEQFRVLQVVLYGLVWYLMAWIVWKYYYKFKESQICMRLFPFNRIDTCKASFGIQNEYSIKKKIVITENG